EVPRLDAGRRAAARRTAQLRAAAGVRGRARAEGARRDPGRRVLATGRAALLSSPAVRLAPARPRSPRRLGDPAFRALSLAFALSVIAIAGTIAVVLLRRSALARAAFGWSFLWTSTWDPVALRFGALPFIYGTLATTAIAIAIALPLGLGAAVCLAELMPRRLADPLTFLIELLVAVPSVIYGLVGMFVLVPAIRSLEQTVQPVLGSIPLFAGPAYGVGLLAAGILLAVMIVPFIVSVSREVLLALSLAQHVAALALGATHWETVRDVVVPYARSGILGSVFLALAPAPREPLVFGATAGATFATLGVLVFLLGYIAWQGATSLSWSFFTALPAPVGEAGGGMANAIVGSAKLLLTAAAVGIPVGFLGGVYLAEYGP